MPHPEHPRHHAGPPPRPLTSKPNQRCAVARAILALAPVMTTACVTRCGVPSGIPARPPVFEPVAAGTGDQFPATPQAWFHRCWQEKGTGSGRPRP
jgi:hypothetical protein